ncbi:MAG TPA: hypothetical protein VMV45_01755 [Casimicrobiaceae bacterium]|nr:hypothetical protein [Casimicrobiaceae bacterium]
MTSVFKAWQCIGCGRIDGPQTCIGICQDRKAEFVYAAEYRSVAAELDILRDRERQLHELARQLACTTPREDSWEASYRHFQDEARKLLAAPPAKARDG